MGEKEFDKIKGAISLAREVGSLSPTDTTLQSHGKIQGMDAFSWHNPNIFVLDKTIESFPFRTIWLGNAVEINEYMNAFDEKAEKVEEYLIYGECEDIVKQQKKTKHFPTLSTSLLELKRYSFSPGILLFTASDSDSPFSMNYFSSIFSKLQ